ncbi:MAG TPA: CHAT domain-containing protein [Pyrinomonadaceae bacterium]|nr:CHAT domain-containing protein [Pyrinomonadaceae bacterium]
MRKDGRRTRNKRRWLSLYILLPSVAVGLVFPVYAPEASDKASVPARETKQKSAIVAERQQSLSSLLVAAGKLRQTNDTKKTIETLNEAGQLQLKLFLKQEALSTFQQSQGLLDQITDPVTTVDTLNGLASAHIAVNKYDLAQPILEQARTISEQNNYPAGKAEALLLLSACQNNTNHAIALNTASEALQLWQSIGDDRGAARTHVAIGLYHFAQSSLVEAAQDFERALNLASSTGDTTLQAESLVYLGYIEYRKEAWSELFSFMMRAEDLIDKESEPYLMGRIAAGYAEGFIETGLPEIGLQKYEEAREYYSRTETPRPVAVASWGIGKAQYILQQYPEALDTLQRTLAVAESNNFPSVAAQCHDYLGRTYAAMNQPEQALQHFETALDSYMHLVNPLEEARLRAIIGQLYQTQGKPDEALQFYQEALRKFDDLKDPIDRAVTLFAMGQLEMKRGDYKTAESLLRQSIETTEGIRSKSTTRDLTFALSAKVYDRYSQYIQCLLRRNDRQAAVQAFEISESARARSLAEFLRDTEIDLLARVDPELSKQEKSLRHSMRAKENEKENLFKIKYDKEELERLNAELAQLQEQYKSLSAAISKRYPAYDQIAQPRGWDLARIQDEVIKDDDTILLEYMLDTDKSHVWAITRNSFNSYEITGDVNKVAEIIYNLSKDPAKDDSENRLTQAAQTLSQMVLSPVASQLHKRRIIVIADGSLNYIPFQMLPSPVFNSEPLVAHHEIIYAPSASILGELREEVAQRGVRSKVLAAFGNPAFGTGQKKPNEEVAAAKTSADGNLRYALRDIELNGDSFDLSKVGQLFFAEREINNLREIATPAETFAVTGFAANRDQLFTMDLSQYAILHFATHGLLDPKRPEYSGILLSTVDNQGKELKGFIGLQDVYSLRAPVDLVVLSACRTGLGKDVRGEGLVGLTRGFMYAGATTVVASLWKVDDEATAELMKLFYREMLQNHKTPDEALRIAQNSIRLKPEWSAPHFWAGFTLQGEYRYVINSERGWRRYSTLIVIGLVMIVLVSVAGWYRYRVRAAHSASKK